MKTATKIAKNSFFLLLTNIIEILSTLTITICIARCWKITEFGQYSFVIAFTGLFLCISTLGMHILITREAARDKSKVIKYANNAFGLGIFLAVLTFLLIFLITALLHYSQTLKIAILLASLYIIVISFSYFLRGAFYAFERMEYETIALLVEKVFVVTLALSLVLIWHKGLIDIVAVILGGKILNLLTSYIIYSKKIGRIKIERDIVFWRFLLRKSLPFGLNILLSTVYIRIGIVMLTWIKGAGATGLYKAGFVLITNLSLIAIILNTSLFPLMSRSYKTSRDSLIFSIRKSLEYLFAIGFPLAIAIGLLAERIVSLLYSTKYLEAVPVLQILILLIPFRLMNNTFVNSLTSIDKQQVRTTIVAISTFLIIVLNLLLIPIKGAIGASIAALSTEIVLFASAYFCLSKFLWKVPIVQIIKKSALPGLVMGLYIFFAKPLNLVLLIPSAIVIYLILLYLLKGITQEDINIFKQAILIEKGV